MNDTTEYRVAMVRQRTEKLERRREHKLIASMSLICIFLVTVLTIVFKQVTNGSKSISMVTDFGGSVLLNQSSGGYVLVGLIAFVAGVAVTSLCIHFRKTATRINADIKIPQAEGVNNAKHKPL